LIKNGIQGALFRQLVDLPQVPAITVVIQPIPHNETVRDGKPKIVYLDGIDRGFLFVQERANLQ
jgi:hypothetical protein